MFHCTTHARSTLLKCARDTSILGFADRAMSRISAPMFSPSLSQSVQMNSMLQRDAWCLMLSAIPSMFYPEPQQRRSRLRAKTHFGNRLLDRRIEQLARLHGLPVVVRRAKVVPHQMPRHAREHDAALAPRRTEDVVEAKVLDVRSGDIGLSGHVSSTFNQPCPNPPLGRSLRGGRRRLARWSPSRRRTALFGPSCVRRACWESMPIKIARDCDSGPAGTITAFNRHVAGDT